MIAAWANTFQRGECVMHELHLLQEWQPNAEFSKAFASSERVDNLLSQSQHAGGENPDEQATDFGLGV